METITVNRTVPDVTGSIYRTGLPLTTLFVYIITCFLLHLVTCFLFLFLVFSFVIYFFFIFSFENMSTLFPGRMS